MHRTRVKICGITSPEDALAAVEAGADAIGLVFAESPRRVDPAWARRIVADVPPYVSRVGVFVDEAPDAVAGAVRRVGLDTVQLHGRETPEECAGYDCRVVKALRVDAGFSSTDVEPYRGCDAVLLDTYSSSAAGGTGACFDWTLCREVPDDIPFVLAGGLDPMSVGEAVRVARPYAVDVSSGVERQPGEKDATKMSAFVAAVRAADTELWA
jgi:phosphoribosylanthranilate isomerase